MFHCIAAPLALLAAAALCASSAAAQGQELSSASPAGENHVLSAELPASVHRYYDEGGERLFTGSRRGRRNLAELVEAMERLAPLGIDPEDYGYSHLAGAHEQRGADIEAAAALALTSLASDLREGRTDPLVVYTEADLERKEASRTELLRGLAEAGSVDTFLGSLRDDNPIQSQLADYLRRYRGYADRQAWRPISISAEVLEEDDRGREVALVRERLAAEGFIAPARRGADSAEALYDEELAEAVSAFQTSRGIAEDGVVGPSTLARMNETPQELVDRIRLNLERARWLPQEFGERHLMVNIADFTVSAFERERKVLTIRTVVGTSYNKTPVFADEMEYVVANPYWNIPNSILIEEIAPAQAKDPGYLARKNMEVVDGWGDDAPVIDPATINWRRVDGSEGWRVRQRGGPSNALGLIKFIFPNRYAVYLHDSPAESLFDRPERTFSHGCIRVEDPAALAEWVLEGTTYEDRRRIDALLSSGERTKIDLPRTIPVYVTYFTVWPNEDGSPLFLDDVYDRDAPLAEALRSDSQNTGRRVAALLR